MLLLLLHLSLTSSGLLLLMMINATLDDFRWRRRFRATTANDLGCCSLTMRFTKVLFWDQLSFVDVVVSFLQQLFLNLLSTDFIAIRMCPQHCGESHWAFAGHFSFLHCGGIAAGQATTPFLLLLLLLCCAYTCIFLSIAVMRRLNSS